MKFRTNMLGFTLLELMVVLLILALLASIAAPQVMKHLSKAKSETAKIQVDALTAAVGYFQIDTGRVPTNEEGLKELIQPPANEPKCDGPYVQKQDSLTDPWGNPIFISTPENIATSIFTRWDQTARKAMGDARDIGNW